MAFGRIIEADIGLNNNMGLRISGLDMSFDIERTNKYESNYGNFTIFNCKAETKDKILQKNNNIILRCGYKDEKNLAMIFYGIIEESSYKKTGTTYEMELFCRDIGNNKSTVIWSDINSFSYATDTLFAIVLNDMANISKFAITGKENIFAVGAGAKLQNGFSFCGSISKALKKINEMLEVHKLGIYFDLGELIIYKKGFQDMAFGEVFLSPNSGMLGSPEEIIDEIEPVDESDEKRLIKTVKVSSLLNPKLKPNTLIKIQSEKTNGVFRNRVVKHVGDTMGGEFISVCEAVE